MKDISQALKKRLAQKGMSKLSIGAFLVFHVKKHLQYPELCTGYVKHNILFLKCDQREDKTSLFLKRKKIIDGLQKQLDELGYVYILRDLRL